MTQAPETCQSPDAISAKPGTDSDETANVAPLACPFCGGQNICPSAWDIQCSDCSASIPGDPLVAIKAWNRRAAPTLPADVKGLVGRLQRLAGSMRFLPNTESVFDIDEAIAALTSQSALLEMDGVAEIIAERRRQIEAEGWSAERDDAYTGKELARAAACYALAATSHNVMWRWWPWSDKWWKPTDHLRNLEKAGALIAAEIARLKRLAKAEGHQHD